MENSYRKTFLREWREFNGKTLEQVADALHMTHGQLSKIERGIQPYNQKLLERLAELYSCEPEDLIGRPPKHGRGMWNIWRKATPSERDKIVSIVETLFGEPPEIRKGESEGDATA